MRPALRLVLQKQKESLFGGDLDVLASHTGDSNPLPVVVREILSILSGDGTNRSSNHQDWLIVFYRSG